MTTLPTHPSQSTVSTNWQEEYVRILAQRLARSLDYLQTAPAFEQIRHARSFLILLSEAHRFPELTAQSLELIAALHPLPIRWQMTYAWEPELRFALEHTPTNNPARRAEYRCGLGDLLLFTGRFAEAVEQCRIVLEVAGVPEPLKARAGRIAFLSLRFSGNHAKADEILNRERERIQVDCPVEEVPPALSNSWLVVNQSWLEVLREKDRVDEALSLVNDMIALDRRLGCPDPIRSADLLTQRSTLLWSRARYPEAVDDLKACIRHYCDAGDFLNAESRQSNLGLIYWSMGELERSEYYLRAALGLYQKIGLKQMQTLVTGNLGLVYFSRGDLDEAARFTREQMAMAQEINFVTDFNRSRWNLAFIRFYQGSAAEIKDLYDSTLEYYEKRGNRDSHYSHLILLAMYYRAQGEPQKALDLARQTVQIGARRKAPILEQIAQRTLASLLPAEEREAPLLRCLELATHTGRKLEIAAAWLGLATARIGAARREQAWQTGVNLLSEIGAERWLEGRSQDDPPFLPPFI